MVYNLKEIILHFDGNRVYWGTTETVPLDYQASAITVNAAENVIIIKARDSGVSHIYHVNKWTGVLDDASDN